MVFTSAQHKSERFGYTMVLSALTPDKMAVQVNKEDITLQQILTDDAALALFDEFLAAANEAALDTWLGNIFIDVAPITLTAS